MTKPDHVIRLERSGSRQAHPIHERPVGGTQVLQDHLVTVRQEPAVAARNRRRGDHQIEPRLSADEEIYLLELDLFPRGRTFFDD